MAKFREYIRGLDITDTEAGSKMTKMALKFEKKIKQAQPEDLDMLETELNTLHKTRKITTHESDVLEVLLQNLRK